MIRETLECFIPVIQNQTDYLIYNLLLNNTFSAHYYHKEQPTFSLSRVEYLDIETLIEDPLVLLGRTLFSRTTKGQALITDILTINNRLLVKVDYTSLVYFNNNEDLLTIVEYPGQIEYQIKVVYRYFRQPRQILSNSELERRLQILRPNKQYQITELRDKTYEFNNVIVIIVNTVTKKKEVYFVQEDNRTAILI